MKKMSSLGWLGVTALFWSCESTAPSGPVVDLNNCQPANPNALYTCEQVSLDPNLGIAENTFETCVDGFDNDLDNYVDAEDPDCAAFYTPTSSSIPVSSSSIIVSSSSVAPPTSAYPFGILPTNANTEWTSNLYNQWISGYYELSGDGAMARIRWDDPKVSVSEGTAYGMLLTFFNNDRTRFNQLTAYALNNLNDKGVMSWKLNGFSGVHSDAGSSGGAADADLDAATALILAYWKWGDANYLTWAQQFINAIWDNYFKSVFENSDLICISDAYCPLYNPSYFSPVAFRLFAVADPGNATRWNRILGENYTVVIASQTNTNSFGLFPNWTDEYGTPDNKTNPGLSKDYNKWALEAVRVPWRLTWDYLWFGEERARVSMVNFLTPNYNGFGGNVYATGQKYRLDSGAPVLSAAMPSYAGAFCLSGMVDPARQAFIDDCYPKVVGMSQAADQYFHTILQNMFMQLMTGLYTKPAQLQ